MTEETEITLETIAHSVERLLTGYDALEGQLGELKRTYGQLSYAVVALTREARDAFDHKDSSTRKHL